MRHLQQYKGFDNQEALNSIAQPGTRREEHMLIEENKGHVLKGWVTRDNSLYKRFVFENFDVAMEFMNEVAEVCTQMNHHPKWTNIYKEVECWLRTHDAEAITDADHELAQAMDRIASGLLLEDSNRLGIKSHN